jgi:hypothetical protein
MKKLLVLPFAAVVAFAGCSDLTTAPVGEAQFSGVSAPKTAVTGTIQMSEATIRESGPSNNENGTCEAGGAFRNNGGKLSSSVPHEQCMTAGAIVPVVLNFSANYVQATSGNVQLNFGQVCDPEDPSVCSKVYLHYKKNSDTSEGAGTLFASSGGLWELLLMNVSGDGNLLIRTGTNVPARHNGQLHLASLAW